MKNAATSERCGIFFHHSNLLIVRPFRPWWLSWQLSCQFSDTLFDRWFASKWKPWSKEWCKHLPLLHGFGWGNGLDDAEETFSIGAIRSVFFPVGCCQFQLSTNCRQLNSFNFLAFFYAIPIVFWIRAISQNRNDINNRKIPFSFQDDFSDLLSFTWQSKVLEHSGSLFQRYDRRK